MASAHVYCYKGNPPESGKVFARKEVRYFLLEECRAQLFEGQLVLNLGLDLTRVFFFLCSKAFSRTVFSVICRTSNRQLVDKKN